MRMLVGQGTRRCVGVYVPTMTRTSQNQSPSGALLLVSASPAYGAAAYIRGYDQFLADRRGSSARK